MPGTPTKKKTVRRRPPPPAKKAWAAEVAAKLAELYPDAHCELDFADPYQLLTAVILSAQCTDKLVNQVTPGLFARFPTPAALAAGGPDEVESLIRRIGLFRNKAKWIRAMAADLVAKHGGSVPKTMEDLVALPGVGRKTANVVLGECYRIAVGVVTDTHVIRLSERIGLSKNQEPIKLEQDLMELLPQEEWILFAHRLIWHGRRVCYARKPECRRCGLRELCKYPDKTPAPQGAATPA